MAPPREDAVRRACRSGQTPAQRLVQVPHLLFGAQNSIGELALLFVQRQLQFGNELPLQVRVVSQAHDSLDVLVHESHSFLQSPTGDLDRERADEILNLLEKLNREFKKSILMVTHDPAAAERATTIRRLDKGRLL